MVRTPIYDKNGMKKGTWTPEEDRKLVAYVTRYGYWNWRQLPKFAGLSRCGKSCRLRWVNYLRPNLKRGNFTREEEETIITLHESMGNRWSAIAAKLPGRTDNEVKNHWHTALKKRSVKKITNTESAKTNLNFETEKRVDANELVHDHDKTHLFANTDQSPDQTLIINSMISPSILMSSPQASSSEVSSMSNGDKLALSFTEASAQISDGFWTETFMEADINNTYSDISSTDILVPYVDFDDQFLSHVFNEFIYTNGLFT